MSKFIERYLDPIDRLTEMIYGLLIVMTFTLGVQAIDTQTGGDVLAAREGVQSLFVAAIGCVVAWGIIDGVVYVLTCVAERSQRQRLRRLVTAAPSEDAAVQRLRGEIDSEALDALSDTERDELYRGLYQFSLSHPPSPVGMERDDLLGGLAIFAVSVVATLPVAIPFLLVREPALAMRVSNLLAIGMLFFVGYKWAQYVETNPWKIGLFTAGIGVAIVLIAIPLGG